jgi:hypothetical protein
VVVIGSNGSSNEHVYPNVVEGIVEATNERGIRIDGEWLNVSKFRPVPLPDVGAVVRIKVQPKGYINSLEIIKATVEPPTSVTDRDARETRISRLAVLKAAAAFGASRPDCKSADVLRIAESWLAWVLKRDS